MLKILILFGAVCTYGLFSLVLFSINASFIHPILGLATNPLFMIGIFMITAVTIYQKFLEVKT